MFVASSMLLSSRLASEAGLGFYRDCIQTNYVTITRKLCKVSTYEPVRKMFFRDAQQVSELPEHRLVDGELRRDVL